MTHRLSFTIDQPLYERMEAVRKAKGYTNRSKFLRDAVSDYLVREAWHSTSGEVVGILTLVYNPHSPELTERLLEAQHHDHGLVLASTHVHLDRDTCVEVVILKGPVAKVASLASKLRAIEGVLHASICASTTGRELR